MSEEGDGMKILGMKIQNSAHKQSVSEAKKLLCLLL